MPLAPLEQLVPERETPPLPTHHPLQRQGVVLEEAPFVDRVPAHAQEYRYLSQGQLQRLAIARAVCSGAPVMVLDEVTSALDGKTEADVLANMAALPGRTVFVAAHRAKAREFATMRLRVDGGVVSAEG